MPKDTEEKFSTTLVGFAVGSAALLAGLVWLALPSAPSDQMTADKMSTKVSHLEDGAAIVSVTVPGNMSEAAISGKKVFEENCVSCHGDDASGRNGLAPPLIHKIYEPSHHGDRAFYSAAANGVRGHHWRFGDMPAIEGVTQDDVRKVIAYIRELQRANGIH
jgi:cytochrome c2